MCFLSSIIRLWTLFRSLYFMCLRSLCVNKIFFIYCVLSKNALSHITCIFQALRIVNKYTCADGGDKTFNGTMIKVDENHVSLHYESMWMCATMPHPDTDSGNILFDTLTGLIVN